MAGRRYLGAGLDLGVDPGGVTGGATKQYVDQWKQLNNTLSSPSASITSATLVNILSVTLLAVGTYTFFAEVGLVGNATTSTPGIQLSGTMVTSDYRWMANFVSNNALAANISTNSTGTTLITTGTALGALGTTTAQQGLVMSGRFVCGTAGTCTIAMSVTAGTGQFSARSGSGLYVTRTA